MKTALKKIYHKIGNRNLKYSDKLHLGCGDNLLPGWSNVDFNGWKGVISHNLTKPLPVKENSVSFIFTEHFIEHIDRKEGVVFLSDCYRVLKPNGVLRLSTPNLKTLVNQYLGPYQESYAPFGSTTCQYLNTGVRAWGHQFIYDYEEMELALKEAGFQTIYETPWHQSQFPELTNLESRPNQGDLIIEAVKNNR